MNRILAGLFCLLLALPGSLGAQQRPYADGPVIVVTAIKVMDGQFENYMEYLNGTWRKSMEASKEAGLVTDFRVYSAQAHNPNEADLYLVTTYRNMASFDGIDEKMDPIMAKVTRMNYRQADESSGKRVVMRTVLGSQMMRELVFK